MDSNLGGSEMVEPTTDNRAGVAVVVVSTLIPLTALVVAMRFYARQRLDNRVSLDDWGVLVAILFVIANGITICLMAQVGLGQHIWNLSDTQIESYFERFYIAMILYYCGLGSIKISLLLQYRRIFGEKLRKTINIALLIISSWSISVVMLSIFSCVPIQGYWQIDTKATCIPNFQWYIHSAGNILSDIAIFTMPIPALWSMRVSIGQRLLLILVSCLGLFNCGISGIRIMYLPIVNINPDVTYENLDASAWSIAEVSIAIICACLPTLRPIYARIARERRADYALSSCRPHKALLRRESAHELPTPVEAAKPGHPRFSFTNENHDIEKLSTRVSTRPSTRPTIDTSCEGLSRTYHSRASSQCESYSHHEFVGSPHSERRVARTPSRGPLNSPFPAPNMRRRPSVQSILDEIVVTQPPSAIIHEALGSDFPVRVAGNVRPLGHAHGGRYSLAGTVAGDGLSAPRPRIQRMGSEGSAAVSPVSNFGIRRQYGSARAHVPADHFNVVDFQAVGWTSPRQPASKEADMAPGDFV